jgi:integrase
VTTNPARQVRHKREGGGRLRFLTRKEYDSLCEVIRERFPEHIAEFIVSVNTGMRLSEQYSLTWGQVHLDRRTIDLTKTKNGSARTVHLNADSIAALESIRLKGQKSGDPVFPREGSRFDTPLMVCSVSVRYRDRRICMALEPAYVLFVAGDGWRNH